MSWCVSKLCLADSLSRVEAVLTSYDHVHWHDMFIETPDLVKDMEHIISLINSYLNFHYNG